MGGEAGSARGDWDVAGQSRNVACDRGVALWTPPARIIKQTQQKRSGVSLMKRAQQLPRERSS